MWRVDARKHTDVGVFATPDRWFRMDWSPDTIGWLQLCENAESIQVRYHDYQMRVFYVVE